jgi:hypothetical protein
MAGERVWGREFRRGGERCGGGRCVRALDTYSSTLDTASVCQLARAEVHQ